LKGFDVHRPGAACAEMAIITIRAAIRRAFGGEEK